MEKRMYVLVRSELEANYRAAQGGHALTRFIFDHPNEASYWNNQYLIFVSTRFEDGIDWAMLYLDNLGIKYSVFTEPDMRQRTALAVYCDPEVMKDYPLAH